MHSEPKTTATAGAAERRDPARIHDIFLQRLADLEDRVGRELERPAPASGPTQELVVDVAREIWRAGSRLAEIAADAGRRRAALAGLLAAGPVDDLGIDEELAATVCEIIRPLARRWLGVHETAGAALPERGGVLVLLNRSAWPLPLEALVLWSFLADRRGGDRKTLALWDDELPELPWISDFLRRIGIVTASADNCRVLLERGHLVLAYPEGRAAGAKTYDRRYRLARFDQKDLIEAAVQAGARIVPGAIVGSEESFPVLGYAAGFPITPTFPLLGLAGLLPLPLTWTFRLGTAVEYALGDNDRADVDGIADAVRARIQAMLGELLGQRDSIVGG